MSLDVQLDVFSVQGGVGGSHVWLKCPALKLTIADRSLKAVCCYCVICTRRHRRHHRSSGVAMRGRIIVPNIIPIIIITNIDRQHPRHKKKIALGKVVRMRTGVGGGMIR